jgi:hypothetical protein
MATFHLGDADSMDLHCTPAATIKSSAVMSGWLQKEGTKGSSGLTKIVGTALKFAEMDELTAEAGIDTDVFKNRWFVLWRHPDVTQGEYSLLWYETPESKKPKGVTKLVRGEAQIALVDKATPGHNFVFKLKSASEVTPMLLDADGMDSKIAWMNMFDRHIKVVEYVDNEDVTHYADLPLPQCDLFSPLPISW